MKNIPLTQGKSAIVDDADFDRLNQFKWFAQRSPRGLWYARRNINLGKSRGIVHVHREVLNLKPEDPEIDHRNQDGLDNQKHNLRLASHGQNMMNRRPSGRSGYKGVSWQRYPKQTPWVARIRCNGTEFYLGFFGTPEEGARAYNKKAIELFGEFARLNPV